MKNIKLLGLAAAVLALIPLLAVFCRAGGQVYRHQKLVENFIYNNRTEQYQRMVPMDRMDLSEYSRYLEIAQTAVSMKVSNVIALPEKIQYYKLQDGKKIPALEIPKGASILWIPSEELNEIYTGYGLRGYPTYEKGWRYVKPFMLSGRQADAEQLPYYFAETKDLEAVAKAAFNSNSRLMKSLKSQGRSVEDAIFIYTRFIDNIFYDQGIFCSPDLQEPVWGRADTILLCLFIALLSAARFLLRPKSPSHCHTANKYT